MTLGIVGKYPVILWRSTEGIRPDGQKLESMEKVDYRKTEEGFKIPNSIHGMHTYKGEFFVNQWEGKSAKEIEHPFEIPIPGDTTISMGKAISALVKENDGRLSLPAVAALPGVEKK